MPQTGLTFVFSLPAVQLMLAAVVIALCLMSRLLFLLLTLCAQHPCGLLKSDSVYFEQQQQQQQEKTLQNYRRQNTSNYYYYEKIAVCWPD